MIALLAPPVATTDGQVTIDLSGPLRDLLCDLAAAMHTNSPLGLALDDLDTALADAAAGPDPDGWLSEDHLAATVINAQDAVLRLLGDAVQLRMSLHVAAYLSGRLMVAAGVDVRLAG